MLCVYILHISCPWIQKKKDLFISVIKCICLSALVSFVIFFLYVHFVARKKPVLFPCKGQKKKCTNLVVRKTMQHVANKCWTVGCVTRQDPIRMKQVWKAKRSHLFSSRRGLIQMSVLAHASDLRICLSQWRTCTRGHWPQVADKVSFLGSFAC